MSRIRKGLLLGGVALVAPALLAMTAQAGGGWGRDHGRGGFELGLFDTFDANGDGRLTQAEVDEVRRSRLAEFDRNGDGNLSLEEYQALWADAMREHMVDRFQALDDDGDATVTGEEFIEPYRGVVSRLDEDGDGALTGNEMRRRHGDRDER